MLIHCTIAGEVFEEEFADHRDLHVVAQAFGDRYCSGVHHGDWNLFTEEGVMLDPGAMVRDLESPRVRATRKPGYGG